MKTEDWKAKMMDYLYDELSPEDKDAFDTELAQNSELREELQSFQVGKNVLSYWGDEKISAPPFFNVYKNHEKNSSQTGLKWFLSIAASVVILMLAAKFTGLEISNRGEGFRIAFVEQANTENQLNKTQIQTMMRQVLNQYEQKLSIEREMDKKEMKNYLLQQATQNRKLVNNYLVGMQESNVEMMESYWKESNQQQQLYTEKLLTNFAEYVEDQRQEDMDYLFGTSLLLKQPLYSLQHE